MAYRRRSRFSSRRAGRSTFRSRGRFRSTGRRRRMGRRGRRVLVVGQRM